MKTVVGTITTCALLALIVATPAAAQNRKSVRAVTLQATGTFAGSGQFTGTATINRFEQRGNQIVAVGFVQGSLTRENRALGSVLAGEVVWSVRVSSGGVLIGASGREPAAPQFSRVAASSVRGGPRVIPIQAQACQVLDIILGPVDVNLLGATISLDAVSFSLAGESGTPLGDLVCAASDLLGNVAAVVNLLNSLLGLLTGLLGGLTGGIGGILPGVTPGV